MAPLFVYHAHTNAENLFSFYLNPLFKSPSSLCPKTGENKQKNIMRVKFTHAIQKSNSAKMNFSFNINFKYIRIAYRLCNFQEQQRNVKCKRLLSSCNNGTRLHDAMPTYVAFCLFFCLLQVRVRVQANDSLELECHVYIFLHHVRIG